VNLRHSLLAVVGAWLLAAPAAADLLATSMTDTLADSTVVERWTLANGLRVTTRHVPGLQAVAMTLGYRLGTDQDPPQREGLAQVMGELGFTAPTADAPERSREDLDSERPLGWSYPVSRRTTLFTEIATLDQFPGALNQVASRMKGVQVTPDRLSAAIKSVQREMGEQFFGRVDLALRYQVREVALEHSDERIFRRATGKDLEGLTLKETQEHLRKAYVPANAALSLVGDLSRLDVHRLVESLFGSIPGGTPLPPAPEIRLVPGSRTIARAGDPAGVVAVIAPPVSDSLHPSFYFNTLLLGAHCNVGWQIRGRSFEPRYQYALFDEPELVRFYPPLRKRADLEALSERMSESVETLQGSMVPRETYEEVRSMAVWLLGGALTGAQLGQVRTETGMLHMLVTSQAARTLWGGDEFWDDYRRRFEAQRVATLHQWVSWFTGPEHQVRLLFAPRK
jgi:peptidase M16-like protein